MEHTTWLQNNSGIDDNVTSHIKDMVREKGETCVSIIVPTHRVGQDRQADRLEIERAVAVAKKAVMDRPGDLALAIDSLFQQIDFTRNKEGIGIFVSPHLRQLVRFPFTVTRKIVVEESFDLHDLLYIENYSTVYYLLDISKKIIHLFRGVMDHLEEIKDDNFPKEFVEDYEYNKPSPSGSATGYAQVKDVEKDKSILHQARLRKILQQADKSLSKYIFNKDVPLLICGPEKNLAIYRSVTNHVGNIVTPMTDNYKGASIHDLAILAWPQIKSYLDEQKLKLVSDFKEKLGKGLAACGVEDIWPAASEGRGLILLVEKDYEKAAVVTSNNKSSLEYPDVKHIKYPDVVNEIMTTVLDKNGKVIIVEKNVLKDYKRIGLIMRY